MMWPVLLLILCAKITNGFRILQPGAKVANGTYFKPFDQGFVGIYGDPTNYQRERINEGAFETSDQELLYEGVSPRQSCPGMVGPFSDGNYYCSAREFGYCDRRSGTCFCNTGYTGIDCTECSDSHFSIGTLCFPKKLCPDDCSGSGVCNFLDGTCTCLPHRKGDRCEILLCSKHAALCETCTEEQCLKCSAGYYLTGTDEVCGTCYNFDPRCAGCTLEEGCTVCADSTLTSVRRSGYRESDPALPEEENVREFGITLPFGTKSPESFADAESYFVSNTADNFLKDNSISCAQGYNDDETWNCDRFNTSHKVCGHFGVFTFVYPNYEISETSTSIRMQVRRTGGGYGHVNINYYIKHFTTNDSDVIATAPYTTVQRLSFEDGVIERSFLVTILDDNIVEEDEVFQVVLEVPEGGGSVGAQFRTNVTIIDNDRALLSPKLTKSYENTTHARAGQPFSTTIHAVAATGQVMNVGGDRFFATIENNVAQWQQPGTTSGGQRNALRQVCIVSDLGTGEYTVQSEGVKEQGAYQLRIWHAFPNSIRGEYFYDGFFERLAVERLDHKVNFTWGTGNLIPRGNDYISVRWSGAVLPPHTGTYQFKVEADDHARLWINGELLLDHWHERYVNLEFSRDIYLVADELHEVVMEYREVRGEARARLLWAFNGTGLDVVPQANLYSLFQIDRSPVMVTIQSADTAANTTECTGAGLYEGTARHESHFTVCPRDQFRNLRDDDDVFYLSSQLFSANLTMISDLGHSGVGAEHVQPTMRYNPETHCFDFSYTPERAGLYQLGVFFETQSGAGSVHVAGSPFELEIKSDKISGPKSLVHDLPNPLMAEAGQCYNFTVVARDNAENFIFEGGAGIQAYMFRVDYYTVSEGTPMPTNGLPSPAPTITPTGMPSTLFNNSVYTVSPPSDTGFDVVRNGQVIDHRNGNYTVQLCPVISGVYETHVMLNSRGVSNQPFKILSKFHSQLVPSGRGTYYGQYVADSPYKLVVSHTTSSGITSTAAGPGLVAATVGVPVSFIVTVRDPFENVMRTAHPANLLTVVLNRSPNATVNIWNFGNGSYNVEYIPELSGANLITVAVDGAQIKNSPFTVPTASGQTSESYSFAVGPGLHGGVTGELAYFEVYAFDLSGNRKADFADNYTFEVTGANTLFGYVHPCPSPPVVDHPICDANDRQGGHYFGYYRPDNAGPTEVAVFLNGNEIPESAGRRLAGANATTPLLNSPFTATIAPSGPKAENADVSGTLYDNVAGVPTTVTIHLRDKFGNLLLTGGRNAELALLGVGVEWGTIEPLPLEQGLPEQHFYRGFYAGYPDVYGTLTDHSDGRYTFDYTVPQAGEYVMRISLAETGLNASYFNGTAFGHLVDQNLNMHPFEARVQGRAVNLRSSISWTGDLGRRPGVRGDLGEGTYLNLFQSRTEQKISVDLRNIDMSDYLGNTDRARYKFRDEFWSATWAGMITPEYAEEYTFTVEVDSESTALLRIGGRGLEFNNSQPGSVIVNVTATSAENTGRYNFSDTRYREFEVRYVHYTGDAVLKLYWESPSTTRALIPASAFTHWRNVSHFNTTIHPAPLCSQCSTAYGDALHHAQVAVKKSFWVYARDEFSNLMQVGGHEPTMVAIGKDGVAFRGDVTDYGNSTYLIEYYATQAGEFRMYVSIGCCAPHPNVGYTVELQEMGPLLIKGAPFLLTVTPAPVEQSRTVAVGKGLIGGTVGELLSFTTLYRDIHNNPTTAKNPGETQFVITFIDQVTSSEVKAEILHTEHRAENSTTMYTLHRAGKYLMYVHLKADKLGSKSKQIIASPFQVTLYPTKADAARTVCRGLGLKQATVNRTASFEIQLYDTFNNNLITGGNRLYVRLEGDATFQHRRLDVTPACTDTQNGRTTCSYVPVYRGAHQLTIRLLNNSVNHPGGLGLTGRYYTSVDGATDEHSVPTFARVDPKVQFVWPDGVLVPSPALSSGAFVPLTGAGQSVRWDGYLVSPRTDTFTLVARARNLNVSVYLDEVLVFDTAMAISEPVELVLDAAYRIRIVASNHNNVIGGKELTGKSIDLRWSTPIVREYPVPTFFLYDSAQDVVLSPFPVVVNAV